MKYLLKIYDQGEIIKIEFDTFAELKQHLINNTDNYFYWINEGVDESVRRELPNFNDDEIVTVDDINWILGNYDYGWWYMEVYEIEPKNFVEVIKQKRLALGLTQKQVSKAVGLSPNYYQQIELGVNTPSFKTLLLLAKLLDIDLGELNEEVSKIELSWVVTGRNYGDALNDYRYITPEGDIKDHLCDPVVFYDIIEVLKIAEDAKTYFDFVDWSLLTDLDEI
jgi:transcriptional regulator with XRE-family HTH domain